MKKYEIMYIIPSKYTDAEMDGIIKKISDIITDTGAEISDTHNLGKRKLAYPIKHQRNGTYILSYFSAETGIIAKLDTVLRMTDELMRHMIVERDPHITQPPVLIEWDDRKEDGRSGGRSRKQDNSASRKQEAPPVQAKPKSSNIKDLDKKLDEILTEEIL